MDLRRNNAEWAVDMELFLMLGALVIGGTVGGLGVGIITGSFTAHSCDECGRAIKSRVPRARTRTPSS